MPERDKQTDAMARTLAGATPRPWNAHLGACPDGIPEQAWHDARATADRVYVDLMEAVDFQRVLIEANKRHLALHPDRRTLMAAADIGATTFEAICHECVREVMLATATTPPWNEEPDSPRYLLYTVPDLGPALPPFGFGGLDPDDPDPHGPEITNFEDLLDWQANHPPEEQR